MILGAFNVACLVSLFGAGAAAVAIALASADKVELALVGLMLAGLADLFDGVVARRLALTAYEKEYGAQLDTVVDAVAFVATPFVIALHTEPHSLPKIFALAVFVLAGIVRLAHFNTLHVRGTDQSTHHRGLPVTYTALFLPLLFIVRDYVTIVFFSTLLTASFLLMGALFVLDVPIQKPHGRHYVLLSILAAALIAYWLWRYAVVA